MPLELAYFYGNEAEQYSFYRIPKTLFTDSRYKDVSMEAKILYGLMLDRMGLSVRNGWLDDKRRVYIFFTMEDSMAMMNCGHNKAVKLFAELDRIGLIERIKQGQGKPAQIYVKNFIPPVDNSRQPEPEPAPDQQDGQTSFLGKSAVPAAWDALTSAKRKSALPYGSSLDFLKGEANKTDKSKTDWNDTEAPSSPLSPVAPGRRPRQDREGQMEAYRTIIRENISYDILLQDYGCEPELIDGYVELMAEACSSTRKCVRVNREDLPTELVRSRLLKLDMAHIAYALDFLSHNSTPVGNIRAYTLSVLYNAPTTMGQYYASQVGRDIAERRGEAGA